MAHKYQFGGGGVGKVRSFPVGLLFTVVTFGIYYWCWYYLVNDELRDIGIAKSDQTLATSNPAMSVAAFLLGGWLVVPPLLSLFHYGKRIRRAQLICGVPVRDQINPTLAFVLGLFGFLVIPGLIHYWYVTKHQNIAVQAAGRLINPGV